MYFVQQLWALLDFINNNETVSPTFGLNLLSQPSWISFESKKQALVEKTEGLFCKGQYFVPDVGRLTRLAGAK
jgi:hypothetical protein